MERTCGVAAAAPAPVPGLRWTCWAWPRAVQPPLAAEDRPAGSAGTIARRLWLADEVGEKAALLPACRQSGPSPAGSDCLVVPLPIGRKGTLW